MTTTLPQPASTTATTTTDYTTDLSRVRSKIGDVGGLTGGGRVYLTDERINDLLLRYPSVTGCAIECVKAMIADVAHDTDFTAGSISTSRTQVVNQLETLLSKLESDAGMEGLPILGGITYSEVTRTNARTDIKPRVFSIGMDTRW